MEVAACGIHCEYCPAYTRKEKNSRGVIGLVHKQKNVKSCFLCGKFPCQPRCGKEAVYTPEALNTWKEPMKRA